jgi:hypothetical protein
MKGTSRYILLISAILSGALTFTRGQAPVFETRSMSFNSSVFNDISPVIVKDGLLFCSDKRVSGITNKISFDGKRLFNIYYVERKDTSNDWGKPQLVKDVVNPLLFYGPLCLAPDGKTVYFTSGLLSPKEAKKNSKKNPPMGIFIGELSGTDVVNVKPFEYNNQNYSVLQPSISKNGKYLFFVSDMPGGQGNSDIWFCEFINNKWSTPVNPGSGVNTSSKENYPYMHSSGRLYFSSNRPGGMGGSDIYYTLLNFGSWEAPVALQADINSPSDDFAFVAEEDLQSGFFTSQRNRGNDDIFSFSSKIIRKAKCDSLQYNNYCYEFVELNAVRFDTIPFRYQWNFGDGAMAEGVSAEHCYEGPGTYIVRLDVVNLITKEVQKNEKTYKLEIKDIVQPFISAPDICSAGKEFKLNADSTNLPGWNIAQYYWNFDDESVSTGKETGKIYSKPGTYNIQLIVTSVPEPGGIIKEACVSRNITVIR